MIRSIRFTCLLDTNVIYPIDVRDLLFWFASYELYTAKWSQHIFDEWKTVMERKGVSAAEIEKRISKAQRAPILQEHYTVLRNFLKLWLFKQHKRLILAL